MKHLLRVLALLLLAWPVAAQQPTTRGTLAATGAVAMDVAGMGTASITVSGTYTGTIQFEVIGGPGTAAVTVDCFTPAAPGTAVNSTTSTGVWVCPVAGLRQIQARMSSYTNGTAVVDILAAPGGGSSGGGGGGSTFDGVLLDAASGDPVTDTANDAIRVNVVAGAGSGGTAIADDAAFTAGTTNVTPAGAVFDDTTPDSVNENDAGAVRMSANRNLYTTIRDAGGNERGVTVTANNELLVELGAGSASIGTLGANSGVDIGDVDVTSVTPGTGAGNLGKAEDAAHSSGDTIIPVAAVRRDTTPSSSSGTAGDYSTLNTDGNGRLYTQAVLYNSSGTELTPSTDKAEDAAHSDGDTGPVVLTRRIDTPASSAGSSGDYATFNSSAEGGLYVAPVATAGSGAGATTHNVASAASTNATSVKASAGNLYSITLINTTATLYYLRLYNLSTSPTCSSATGYVTTVPIPASTSGAGIVSNVHVGLSFATGIAYCITGGASSTDNTNAATGIYGFLAYK